MKAEDIDAEDMKSVIENFPNMCREGFRFGDKVEIKEKVYRIVVTGMGGSGISGDILKSCLHEESINVHVCKDYKLFDFVDKKTLVFVVSYSGNTEETISAYQDAVKKQAQIVAICSGGKLANMAKKDRNSLIKIPVGIQPRLATAYLFFPMLKVLQKNKIIKNKDEEVHAVIDALEKPVFRDMAEDLVPKIVNKIPLIYASQRYYTTAMKWKTDINENTKIHAFYNIYPEFNHNEINGYVNKIGDFYVIIIRDEDEQYRIRKRMKATKEIIKNKGVNVTEIVIKGDNYLTKLFSTIYIGTWVSYFLALEYETDPTPVEIIEELKKKLK